MDVSIAHCGAWRIVQRVFRPRVLMINIGIKYEDIAYGTHNAFASVGSNNGHNGSTAITMYHNSDVVTDYAWRSCVALLSYLTASLMFVLKSRLLYSF